MPRRLKKRVPLVIVHDSSSSDTEQEPVTATEPDRVPSICFDTDNMSLSSEHIETAQPTPPLESATRESDQSTGDHRQLNLSSDPPQPVDFISKYCLSKQGRLHCNFNPSVTNNRGCQTNFASNELSKLISHLNTFHGCTITDQQHYGDDKSESSIDKFYSPFNLSDDYPNTADTELYKDNNKDDSDLYLDSVLNSFLNLEPDHVSSLVEKQSFISQQQQLETSWPNTTESTTVSRTTTESTTVSLSQLEFRQSNSPLTTAQPTTIPKKPTPKPRKIKKPLVSRVTPKFLRSATNQLEIDEELKKSITNKRKAAIEETKTRSSAKRKLLPRPEKKVGRKKDSKTSFLYDMGSLESTPELSNAPTGSIRHHPKDPVATQKKKGRQTYTSAEEPVSVSIDEQTNTVVNDTAAGAEFRQVIPALPTDGLWPFEFGYGFFMKQKYHCNVSRSSGLNGCKKAFANRSVFIQHLHHAHHLNAANAMSSRESEEDNLHEKIIDMLVSASLPCSFVNDKRFLSMVKSIQETSAGQEIIPSVQETEHLMEMTFEKRQNQIKSLLQEQDHISFSVHTFHPLHHANEVVIVITAFFIDKEWRIKELVIQFKTLHTTNDLNSVVESVFVETIQRFDIAAKVYLIVSPDFPTIDSHMHNSTPVMFQISAGISKQVIMPCLDQVIRLCKSCLCQNMESLFEPLCKINNFKAKIRIYSWKGNESVDIAQIVNFSKNNFATSFDLLREFMKITKEYNSVCFLNSVYHSDSISPSEIRKIEKLLQALATLDESYEWLIEATNQRYPVTNKALLIYMEILYSLYQLAQCYGCREESDILYERTYSPIPSERGMIENINNAYTTVVKYRILMEGSTENPTWQAMISDAYSFSMFNARKQYYAEPREMTPFLLMSVINGYEHTISSIDSQTIELKNCIINREKRDKNTQLEVTDPSEKSLSDDSMSEFKKMLQVFIGFPESNLQAEPDSKTTMLTHFLNHSRNNFGQLNFWKDTDSNAYPRIRNLTKQCFAVPITSFECLHMAEEAEDYYAGIAYLFPKATTEENQRRTLFYMWQKYIDF